MVASRSLGAFLPLREGSDNLFRGPTSRGHQATSILPAFPLPAHLILILSKYLLHFIVLRHPFAEMAKKKVTTMAATKTKQQTASKNAATTSSDVAATKTSQIVNVKQSQELAQVLVLASVRELAGLQSYTAH